MLPRLTSITLSILLFMGLALPACVRAESKHLINKEEAAAIAEKFIRKNGYTTDPAIVEHLAPELLNRGISREQELSARHDTLEPQI